MSRKENLFVRLTIAGALALGAAFGFAVADGAQVASATTLSHVSTMPAGPVGVARTN